jgi:hypothetical protein
LKSALTGSVLMPACASSGPVTTMATPGMPRAVSASMDTMRACGCGERTNATRSSPVGWMSSA